MKNNLKQTKFWLAALLLAGLHGAMTTATHAVDQTTSLLLGGT